MAFEVFDTIRKLQQLKAESKVYRPRAYHLPGAHDQCDHSPTGECVEDEPAGPRAELFKVERGIAGDKYETAAVFSPGGKLLLRKTDNDPYSVDFTAREVKGFKNAVFTHNHPNQSGLSAGDILFAAEHDLAEMRAVASTPTGKVTYLIKRPKAGWPAMDATVIKRLEDKVRTRIRDLVVEGKIGREVHAAPTAIVAAIVADKIGAEYRTVRVKSKGARKAGK